MLGIKFHSMPVYDKKYIKAKVGEFNCVIKTKLLGGEVSRESVHYTCIACVSIDSVLKMEKKNYPQLYLEEKDFWIYKPWIRVRVRIWFCIIVTLFHYSQ